MLTQVLVASFANSNTPVSDESIGDGESENLAIAGGSDWSRDGENVAFQPWVLVWSTWIRI